MNSKSFGNERTIEKRQSYILCISSDIVENYKSAVSWSSSSSIRCSPESSLAKRESPVRFCVEGKFLNYTSYYLASILHIFVSSISQSPTTVHFLPIFSCNVRKCSPYNPNLVKMSQSCVFLTWCDYQSRVKVILIPSAVFLERNFNYIP